MKFRKSLTILTVVCVMITMVAGCTGPTAQSTTAAQASASEAPSSAAATQAPATEAPSATAAQESAAAADGGYTLPLAKGDVTINCWGFPQPDWKVDNLEENAFTKWLEEQTGVNLTFTMGPATERDTKLRLLLSGGEYPEVIFNPGFTPSEQMVYGSSGIILDLSGYIQQFGIQTRRMYDEVPDIKSAVLREGGKIYVMPSYYDTPHDHSYSRLWAYQPWLDKLGIAAPVTTDDYYKMLVRFRDEDPNGNGKKDELPYVAADPVWWSDSVTFIMNSFIYYNPLDMMDVLNGKVTPVYAQEEYREGLRYLNKLYTESLLMPQSFSQNDQALKQLLANDPMIVGTFAAHAPFVYCDEPVYSKLTSLAPFKGPQGVQYTAQYYTTQTDGTVITDKCANPEIAFKMLDFMYSTEASARKSQGIKGVSWDYNNDDKLVNDYGVTPTWVTLLDNGEQPANDRWALMGNGYQAEKYNGIYAMNMSPKAIEARKNNTGKVDGYVQIQLAAMNVGNKYFPPSDIRMPQVMIFSEDESATLADLELAVKNKVAEMRTQFITGSASLDTDWDTYVADLKTLGMDKVISMYQAAYDKR